jgi:hypothetical protein
MFSKCFYFNPPYDLLSKMANVKKWIAAKPN